MKKSKLLFFLISLSLLMNCNREIANLTGKCDKEKEKSKQCLISTVLICQNTPDAERYKKAGVDICTNPDGYAFILAASCEVPEECKPAPKAINSERN